MNYYFEECIKLATKAYKKKEVPIGAVVVCNGKIIGKGYNKRIKSKDVTNHAEIIAIKSAAKRLKDWRLNGCDLYVTLKPCSMCTEVIKESRIDNVYYLIEKDNIKRGYNKTTFNKSYEHSILPGEYTKIMSDFFKENCKR